MEYLHLATYVLSALGAYLLVVDDRETRPSWEALGKRRERAAERARLVEERGPNGTGWERCLVRLHAGNGTGGLSEPA